MEGRIDRREGEVNVGMERGGWLHLVMYGYLRLCMVINGYVWLFMAMYGYIRLRMVVNSYKLLMPKG